ncbi:MAG: RagB/SusD family nutrient uptake outer membrane protein [Tannerellaceae bacterium]
MKKFLSYTILSSALLFSVVGCSDFLDRDPDQILTEDQVFGDPNMIKSVLANFYGRIDWGQHINDNGSYVCLDEALRSNGGPDEFRTFGDGHWRVYDYGLIRNINQFLQGLTSSSALSGDEKASIGGEARFIRAYTYFNTCKGLGGMPIVGDEVFEYTPGMDITALQYPRATEVEMYDYIISECDEIATMFPQNPSKYAARATKGAALALKARAALYAGSIANYNNKMANPIRTDNGEVGIPAEKAEGYYKMAYETALQIMNLGTYTLQNNRADKSDNFYNAVTIKDNNTEVIWAKDYKGPSNYQGFTRSNIPVSHAEDIDCAWLTPVLNLVEAFEYVDGRDGALKLTENNEYVYYDSPQSLFKDKDPRLFATVITPGASYRGKTVDLQAGVKRKEGNGWKSVTGDPGKSFTESGMPITAKNGPVVSGDAEYINKTGFYMMKFMDETTGSATRGKGSEVWFPRFRMGEIYLIAAEAAMELGDQGNALKYINAVRERAGISLLTQTVTIDDIVQERRVELAFENHRYWDLKRLRLADQVWDNNDNNENAVHYVLYPYVIDDASDANNGKWVFDKEKAYMSKYPRFFQLRNYYNFLDQSWLNNNPKLTKNPYQS